MENLGATQVGNKLININFDDNMLEESFNNLEGSKKGLIETFENIIKNQFTLQNPVSNHLTLKITKLDFESKAMRFRDLVKSVAESNPAFAEIYRAHYNNLIDETFDKIAQTSLEGISNVENQGAAKLKEITSKPCEITPGDQLEMQQLMNLLQQNTEASSALLDLVHNQRREWLASEKV